MAHPGVNFAEKDTTMTVFMRPDMESTSKTIMGEAETYQTGMAAIGFPAVSVSVSTRQGIPEDQPRGGSIVRKVQA